MDTETLTSVAHALYGEGAWEIVKALTPEQKKQRRERTMQNIAIGTNAVGSVAGPAAIGLAYRARKTGGMPREGAKTVAPKMARSKNPRVAAVGRRVGRVASTLDNPRSSRAKIAAGAAGAGLIGMQTVNWGGDILSAKLIGDQKKKDQLSKADEKVYLVPKLRVAQVGTEAALAGARKAAPLVAVRMPDTKKVITDKKKVSKSNDLDIHWHGEISKMDTEKRQVFGWASIVEIDGRPVVDLQGDIMTVEEIEKAAYDYVRKSRVGGNQHERDGDRPRHVSDLVESFLVTPEKKAQMGLPDSVPTGWWVGFQINDEGTWEQVKKGERTGFSIHGSGSRKSVEMSN